MDRHFILADGAWLLGCIFCTTGTGQRAAAQRPPCQVVMFGLAGPWTVNGIGPKYVALHLETGYG